MGIGKDKLNTNINPPFVFSFWPCDFHGVLSFHKCARKTGGIKRNVMLTIENWIQRNKEIWWKVGRKSVLATCFFFFYSWRIFSILHVTRETRRVLTEGRHTRARSPENWRRDLGEVTVVRMKARTFYICTTIKANCFPVSLVAQPIDSGHNGLGCWADARHPPDSNVYPNKDVSNLEELLPISYQMAALSLFQILLNSNSNWTLPFIVLLLLFFNSP